MLAVADMPPGLPDDEHFAATEEIATASHLVIIPGLANLLGALRDGDFSFRPGVEVTCVEEVKGLEFDQVILPDLEAYGGTDQSRHALYVASTRASDQLVLAAAGRPSPLLDFSAPGTGR